MEKHLIENSDDESLETFDKIGLEISQNIFRKLGIDW